MFGTLALERDWIEHYEKDQTTVKAAQLETMLGHRTPCGRVKELGEGREMN